jgi:hypothetical protein
MFHAIETIHLLQSAREQLIRRIRANYLVLYQVLYNYLVPLDID